MVPPALTFSWRASSIRHDDSTEIEPESFWTPIIPLRGQFCTPALLTEKGRIKILTMTRSDMDKLKK
ncbi:hypothetical protein R2601_19664 [Salipiger bermudensis HTCC2601]|uniref:Uncharacterized protein n=1 Tax=Salipiger bermudensis (strain DSM 26914 / JCM 13377 / KCTC 12554 / HTCC2601) TaxID=314265 RepID=Q0FU11_SALBH|nr:hypothetical protein R2601_19664 [Salipiger bermudensis HTCC2601]